MKLRNKTKRIFSAALAVWMSGIVVLLCCGNMPTEAASTEIESCPLAKKAHCTKNIGQQDSGHAVENQSPALNCCAFPAKIFDKIRKVEKSPEFAKIDEVVVITAPQFYSIEKTFQSSKYKQTFVRNRGSTYLLNRVFRI